MTFSLPEAYAHCDIPCGIYETDTMRQAATTCLRMAKGIEDLGDLNNKEKMNTFVRLVTVKEQHAERVKHELYVLWSDYFKPEHLEQFPDLHETFWKTVKQASAVKRGVDIAEAEKLEQMVARVAEMFADSKK